MSQPLSHFPVRYSMTFIPQGPKVGDCPTCREPVPDAARYRRNFAVSDAVEPLIAALKRHGHPSWQEGGTREKERRRKEK